MRAEARHIAIDMDGVMVDMVGGICTSVRTEYGVDLRPSDITQYHLAPILDPIIGRSWWDWLRERDWLWSIFPAVEGAIGAIDRLRRDGHYLEVVTAKPDWAEYAVWKWMGKWRPSVNRVTIVPVGAAKSSATDASILVDDYPKNCVEFVAAGGTALLFDQPYNRDFAPADGITRVAGWHDVLKELSR